MSKIHLNRIIALIIIIVSVCLCSNSETTKQLPTAEILGKEYYVYEAQRGESLYGVAKKYGWDIEELISLNPELKVKLNKGDKVYYPTGKNVETKKDVKISDSGSILHTVKKGETVYSISRLYDTPLTAIYASNPESQRGIKSGDVLEIPRSEIIANNQPKGMPNAELQEIQLNHIEDGQYGKTTSKGKDNRIEETKETVRERKGFRNNNDYPKVSSKEFGAEIPGYSYDERNEEILITDIFSDSGEENNFEIEDNVEEVILPTTDRVKIALILDDPGSKKDIDFTRGALLALWNQKTTGDKVDFRVFDGGSASETVIQELDTFEPNLIISTADKVFPLFLVDYSNTSGAILLNVFDLRNNLYTENNSIVQVLPPSQVFNEMIANEIHRRNKLRKLIMVGEPDENDGIGTNLQSMFEEANELMTLEDFGAFEPDIMEPVLFYSFANKKEDIWDFMNNMEHLAENYPGYDFKLVGRTSWIAMIDEFGDKFEEYNVAIPSRVWLNENSGEWKDFIKEYEEFFEGTPVRSIPNFAAAGYDIVSYFVPFMTKRLEQNNYSDIYTNSTYRDLSKANLQMDYSLKDLDDGGWINTTGYIIKFGSDGEREKITVTQ